jgi:hypothetical protein
VEVAGMAVATGNFELCYFDPAPADGIAFRDVWRLTQPGTSDPVTLNVADIYLSISLENKSKLLLTKDNGLTWNDADRSVAIEIPNSSCSFIKDDQDYDYELWVTWETGDLQRIRTGTVTAAKVN